MTNFPCEHLRDHEAGLDWPKQNQILKILTDMHGPNGQNVTIWRVTRCFCGYLTKKFEKMPKSPIF